MTAHAFKASVFCMGAVLAANPAYADVTAQQVWDDFKAYYELYGMDGLTIGSEVMSGDTLTVTDIVFVVEEPDLTITGTLDEMTFTEQGDGTVVVTMSDDYPIILESTDTEETDFVATMALRQSGFEMIVSGTPEELLYDMSADRYAFEVDEVTEDGVAIAGEFRMTLNNLIGNYASRSGELRELDYAISSELVDLLIDVTDPETGTMITMSGKLSDMAVESTMAMPEDADFDDPTTLYDSGFGVSFAYSYEDTEFLFSADEQGQVNAGSGTIGGASAEFAFDQNGLSYLSDVRDVDVAIQGADLPFPIEVSLEEYGIGLSMPLAATEEPEDYAVSINVTDLSLSEEIWALGDPEAILPRDPLTVILDLSGQARLLLDILDPANADAFDDADAPVELYSLVLNELRVAVAGALVTGQGSFTFDNTDTTTFEGFPRPEGTADFTLTGVNGLIDRLGELGILPPDQAMMPRMMLGLFTTAVGDDELTSTIEITPEGQVTANGQRLQ